MNKTKIPIFATIGRSYRFVWDEARDFINLALVPIVVLAIMDTAVGIGFGGSTEAGGEGGALAVLGVILVILVNVVVGIMFAVAWHRRYLVPQGSATFYGAIRWRTRHTRFLYLSIAIGLLVMFTALFPLLIGGLIGAGGFVIVLIALVFGGLLGARLSILLPASAVDDLMSFNQVWILAHRNGWRILLVFVISAIPVGLVASGASFVLRWLIGDAPSPPGLFVMAFTNEFFGFASAALGVTALSEAYRILRSASTGVVTTGSGV